MSLNVESAAGSKAFFSDRYPGVVKEYQANPRICRVHIEGLTDGAEEYPKAAIEYPLGDKSKNTEIEILAGDLVWLCFIGGDPNRPLITGYRNPEDGNDVDWRRIHHKNIEQTADDQYIIKAKKVLIEAEDIQINGKTAIQGSSLIHNGTNVGDTHVHGGVNTGLSTTRKPQ